MKKSLRPADGFVSRRDFLTTVAAGVSVAATGALLGAPVKEKGAGAGRVSFLGDRRFQVETDPSGPLTVSQVVRLTLKYTVGNDGFSAAGSGRLWIFFDIRQWSRALTPGFKNERLRARGPEGSDFEVSFVRGGLIRTFELLPSLPEFLYAVSLVNRGRELQRGEAIEIELRNQAGGFALPDSNIAAYTFWIVEDPAGRLTFEKTHYPAAISSEYADAPDKYSQFQPESEPIDVLAANPLRIDSGPGTHIHLVATPTDREKTVVLSLRPVDKNGNPASSAVPEVVIEGADRKIVLPGPIAPGQRLRVQSPTENVTFRLSSPGGVEARSNPVQTARNSDGRRLFFGDIHGMAFNHRPYQDYHLWAKEIAALDFSAGLMFSYNTVLGDYWGRHKEILERCNEPGRYVSLPAVEFGTPPDGSHRNGYFPQEPRDVPPIFCERRAAARDQRMRKRFNSETVFCEHYRELYQLVKNYGGLVAGHHHTITYEAEHLAEVYQKAQFALGQEGEEARINRHLLGGMKAGIVSGTDTHDNRPGNPSPEAGLPRPGGLTGVWADKLDRESIFEALLARRCFATTGHRPLVQFSIGGKPMGSEVPFSGAERLSIDIQGTDRLTAAEWVVNGAVGHRFESDGDRLRVDCPVAEVLSGQRSCYCYVRIKQADGERAWTSPIWLA